MPDSQTPDWHHTLRDVVQAGNVAAAGEQVEAAYTADPDLRDGFATIGGVYRESKDWAQAAKWFRQDTELGRITWGWQLRYAKVVFELGDESAALQLVEKVYAAEPDATDGYTRSMAIPVWGGRRHERKIGKVLMR